jgi:hypothetical protein
MKKKTARHADSFYLREKVFRVWWVISFVLGQRYTAVQVSQSSGQAFQLVLWGLETAFISR